MINSNLSLNTNQDEPLNENYIEETLRPKELLNKLFQKYDANNNGRLSQIEFSNILRYLAKLTGALIPNR